MWQCSTTFLQGQSYHSGSKDREPSLCPGGLIPQGLKPLSTQSDHPKAWHVLYYSSIRPYPHSFSVSLYQIWVIFLTSHFNYYPNGNNCIHTYIYVYTCVCIYIHIHTFILFFFSSIHLSISIHPFIFIYPFIDLYLPIHMYLSIIYLYLHIHLYLSIHPSIYICLSSIHLYLCIHPSISIHLCIHMYLFIYLRTHPSPSIHSIGCINGDVGYLSSVTSHSSSCSQFHLQQHWAAFSLPRSISFLPGMNFPTLLPASQHFHTSACKRPTSPGRFSQFPGWESNLRWSLLRGSCLVCNLTPCPLSSISTEEYEFLAVRDPVFIAMMP